MVENNFNRPLSLINKKPNGTQMLINGYYFYMIPDVVMKYANRVLTERERRLYYAICGQAERDRNGKPCCWAISHYCEIANIKSNHYADVLSGLVKKGFIVHDKFKSIEVLYPIGENEYINERGEIISKQLEGALPNLGMSKSIPNLGKVDSDFGNRADQLGNEYSQSSANNREIDIDKELDIEGLPSREKKCRKEVKEIVEELAEEYNIALLLIRQIKELRKEGFTYEFILTAIERKDFSYFKDGFNLLFYKPYQEEVMLMIEERRIVEEKSKAELQAMIEMSVR